MLEHSNKEPQLQKQFSRRILVIDDSIDSIRIMNHILDQHKCNVTMSFDGEDAIPLLISNHYDLVILDWQMPQMGGRETLLLMDRLMDEKKIRPRHPIPVVIYTGTEKELLDLPHVSHFEYIGFISKDQPYKQMMLNLQSVLKAI